MNFILLLAFAITAVGYFVYLLNQQEKGLSKDSRTDPVQPPRSPQFLFLVINVLKAEIIETLERKQRIESNDCEAIYRATEFLWVGSKNNINQKLSECFSDSNQFIVSQGQEFEFDVYLVQIELKESDEGFKQGVDQLARIDAFRQLADLSVQVKVSPRLSVEAYQNTGVYLR